MSGFDFLNNFREKLDRLWKTGSTMATNKIEPLRVAKQAEADKYQEFSEKANVVDAANNSGQSNNEMPIPEMTDTQGVNNFMGVNPEVERGVLDWILSLFNNRQLSPVPGINPEDSVPIEEALAQNAVPTPTAIPTPTPSVTPLPSNPTAEILAQYQIPDPIYYGIRQAEGGNIGGNNPMNLGAYDSNPQNAFNYPTPEAGVEAFARLIATDPRYSKAYELRDNPKAMLEEIVKAGYAGDPATWKERSMSQGGAGQNYNAYQDFVMALDGWKNYYDE